MTDVKAADAGIPSDEVMREQRLQRKLKIVVGGLAILILLGLGAVFVKMAELATGSRSRTVVSTVVSAAGKEIGLELPKGARIVSVSLSENRLAVYHDGPAGPGISILDIETGAKIAEVKPQEAVPRN